MASQTPFSFSGVESLVVLTDQSKVEGSILVDRSTGAQPVPRCTRTEFRVDDMNVPVGGLTSPMELL